MNEEIKKALKYAESSNALEGIKPTKEELKSIKKDLEKEIEENRKKIIENIKKKIGEENVKNR